MRDCLGEDRQLLREMGIEAGPVELAALALAGAYRSGGQALVFGNGGSAAQSQHFAAELVVRIETNRAALPALALTTDSSVLTAIANDFGFEHVFSRQIEALGRAGDAAIAISTSGRSANVLAGVEAARRAGMITIGLCGGGGCPLSRSVDVAIPVLAKDTATVQQGHLAIEHALCRALERLLLDSDGSLMTAVPGSVLALPELLDLRAAWRAGGRVVVWTNGCFDLLHAGHLEGLRTARRLGDVLLVGINSDDAVRRLKGEGRPLMPEAERAAMVSELRSVDHVLIFDEDTPEAVIEALRPDIHCKGADYAPPDGKPVPERATVEAYGGRVEFLPLLEGCSTTRLLETINNRDS
jgi:rfaE bifunctional protein nucleotidyltransferase chain/domain